jgi:hypothetical protein
LARRVLVSTLTMLVLVPDKCAHRTILIKTLVLKTEYLLFFTIWMTKMEPDRQTLSVAPTHVFLVFYNIFKLTLI